LKTWLIVTLRIVEAAGGITGQQKKLLLRIHGQAMYCEIFILITFIIGTSGGTVNINDEGDAGFKAVE
jgi:hypothetical protein